MSSGAGSVSGLLPAEPSESRTRTPASPSDVDALVAPPDVRALIELERLVDLLQHDLNPPPASVSTRPWNASRGS